MAGYVVMISIEGQEPNNGSVEKCESFERLDEPGVEALLRRTIAAAELLRGPVSRGSDSSGPTILRRS